MCKKYGLHWLFYSFFDGWKITKLIKSICKGVCSFKDEVNNVEKEIDEINDSEQKK